MKRRSFLKSLPAIVMLPKIVNEIKPVPLPEHPVKTPNLNAKSYEACRYNPETVRYSFETVSFQSDSPSLDNWKQL